MTERNYFLQDIDLAISASHAFEDALRIITHLQDYSWEEVVDAVAFLKNEKEIFSRYIEEAQTEFDANLLDAIWTGTFHHVLPSEDSKRW